MYEAPRIRSAALFLPSLLLTLAACSPPTPQSIVDSDTESREAEKISPAATNAPEVTSESVSGPPQCLENIEQRELDEPYRRSGEDPRFTLSQKEFADYLNLMGIDSLCVPMEFGMPYVNVDWNDLDDPPRATGRMISIGFDNLYPGAGWGSGYILYSTYDFEAGTMYEVYATVEDRDWIRTQSHPLSIQVEGADGFIRYHPGIPMGMASVYKTYIFPFDAYYIAVVLELGAYNWDEVESVIREMEAGIHPDLIQENIPIMDGLVSSIQFSTTSE